MPFKRNLPQMLAELRETDCELPGETDEATELWNLWTERRLGRNKGSRVMMCRFQESVHVAEQRIKWWTMDLMERSYVAIELDMVKTKSFRDKLVAKMKDKDAGEGEGTTSKYVLHLEDKALKTCADNAVGISVMLLEDYDNKRVIETALGVFNDMKAWRTHMVKCTRSCDQSRQFLVQQTCGGAIRHVNRILNCFTDAVRLEGDALRLGRRLRFAWHDRRGRRCSGRWGLQSGCTRW